MSLPASPTRRLALALATLPGLLGAVLGGATYPGLVLVALAHAALAVLVVELRGGLQPSRPRTDALAWLTLCGALTCVTYLSSPHPLPLGTSTPGRRLVLALLALTAGASLTYLLRPQPEETPGESPEESAPPSEGQPG